nr:peptidoglycan editing factor PgeF [Patulibacter sp. SYSU D01012]
MGGTSAPPYDTLNLGLTVGDDPAAVVANRRRFFAAAGLALERSVWPRLVHGVEVAHVGAEDAGRGATDLDTAVPGVDALITDEPGLALCVTVADCVPVVAFDASTRCVGVAHAGWRGTAGGIAARMVRALGERFGAQADGLRVAIGPSIGVDDYEVGPDVIDAMTAAYPDERDAILPRDAAGRTRCDLRAANRAALLAAGVRPDRIAVSPISTAARTDRFFSHRAERSTGRFAAAAVVLPAA